MYANVDIAVCILTGISVLRVPGSASGIAPWRYLCERERREKISESGLWERKMEREGERRGRGRGTGGENGEEQGKGRGEGGMEAVSHGIQRG